MYIYTKGTDNDCCQYFSRILVLLYKSIGLLEIIRKSSAYRIELINYCQLKFHFQKH